MSIRLRLLLSYLAMVLIPIFFAVMSAFLVALLFKGDIKELRNLYLPSEHHHEISDKDQLVITIHRQSLTNPSLFLNKSYLKKLDSQLGQSKTAIIVRKGHKIIFLPSPFKNVDSKDLPAFGAINDVEPVVRSDDQYISIKQIDFLFPDQSDGTLFIVTDASRLVTFVRSSFPILFIALIVILIGTNGMLTYFVSRSIIRPIRELQRAAKEMKEGNLNTEIKANSKDELGQLAQGFEEMRMRLKESIELQNAYEENRKELIANISHDLKTPITTIKGYIEGIRDGVANNQEKQERYIQTIYSKANDLDQMIDELFLYSKLDLQRIPFHFEQIRFNDYLQDFVEELRFDLEKMEAEIDFDFEKKEDYSVIVDREHMKRVITNIVDNSLKYIDKQKKQLHFTLAQLENHILVKMEDNGPGIDEKNLPFIFDQFYRVDEARGTEKRGSGLGLSIAKRIIEEHQGMIWAESSKGKGTAILFTLKKAGVNVEKDINY